MIRLPSIRSKLLAIFVVAGVLPLALITLVSYHNSLRAVEEMVGNRTSRLATTLGTELGRKLDSRVNDRILQVNQPVQDYLEAKARKDHRRGLEAIAALQAYLPSVFKQYAVFYDEMILAGPTGEPLFKFHRTGDATELAEMTEPRAYVLESDDDGVELSDRAREAVREYAGQRERVVIDLHDLRLEQRARTKDLERQLLNIRALRDSLKEKGLQMAEVARLSAEIARATSRMTVEVDPVDVLSDVEMPSPLVWAHPPVVLEHTYSADDRAAARAGAKLQRGEHRLHLISRGADRPPTVCLAQPIYSVADSTRRLGTLLTKLREDYVFPEDYASRGFGESGDLAVVDSRTGEILCHNRSHQVGKNIRLTDPALGLAAASPGGVGSSRPAWQRIRGRDGARLASVFDVPGTPWTVVATGQPREFESEARRAGLWNLIVSSLALILAGGVLVVASGRISRSIGTVTEGARRIAGGNLDGTIRVQTHDEIQTLAETFNTMTGSLRENIQLRERVAAELDALNRTLEQRVHDRTRELRTLNEALNQANQELKELDRLKTNFLATVSHEFKTPLTSIKAFAEILLDEAEESPSSEVTRRFLKIINSESDRLGRLIKHLLDLSRIESNRMAWRMSVFPIHQAVDAAIEGLLPVFGEKRIHLGRDLRCGNALVNADQDRIQEVLGNILDNAIKVSPPGGRIEVGCRKEDGHEDGLPWVRVSIRDEGDGIPPDQLDRIFDRFTQVESARAGIKGGTGLGLAISREIVEHHGGRIWAENAPGRGAVFHFTLPVTSQTEHPVEGRDG